MFAVESCHSRACFIAFPKTSVSEKYLSSNIIYFLLVHSTHMIHGYTGEVNPTDGRMIIQVQTFSNLSIDLTIDKPGTSSTKTLSQTFFTNGQRNIAWIVVSISLHLLHFPTTIMPLLSSASAIATTLFFKFQGKLFINGEHLTFQTHWCQLKASRFLPH